MDQTNFFYFSKIMMVYPSIMHSKFEDKQVEYEGDANTQSIKSFVANNAFGLCGHRTTGNSGEFTKKPLVVVYYDVDYVKNAKGTNYWRNRCRTFIAVSDNLTLNFVICNYTAVI